MSAYYDWCFSHLLSLILLHVEPIDYAEGVPYDLATADADRTAVVQFVCAVSKRGLEAACIAVERSVDRGAIR